MLQSEFYERTGVNLMGDDYAKVEQMYLATQMDKDVFCEEWLKHRDDRIVKELMETIIDLQQKVKDLTETNKSTSEKLSGIEKSNEKRLQTISDLHTEHIEEMARAIIDGVEDSNYDKVYDVIEEELGIAFIIKYKRDSGYELSDSEIDYMVSKL